MGLTKQYLRFVPSGFCNVIGSSSANISCLNDKTCLVGACEHVYAWDVKRREKISIFPGSKSLAVFIRCSPDQRHFAVGYADGAVNIFDSQSPDEAQLTFSGHKSSVTCLDYSADGLLLASGGKDCAAIVWDVVNESGLFKLNGHQGPLTQCRFVKNSTLLVTSSKDAQVKFWDLSSQHCIYTIADHRSEVWDFVFVRHETQLITGSAENELRVFDVTWFDDEYHQSSSGGPMTSSSLIDQSKNNDSDIEKRIKMDDGDPEMENDGFQANNILRCKKFGTILRQAKGRVTQLIVSPDESLLFCLGTGSLIDVYQVLSIEQTKERIRKKLRKLAKKASTSDTSSTVEYDETTIAKDMRTRFIRLSDYKASYKSKSLDFVKDISAKEYKAFILLQNNMIDECVFKLNDDQSSSSSLDFRSTNQISLPGHRTNVKSLSFSHDNSAFLSCSQESVKVWNRNSLSCVRTISCNNNKEEYTVALFIVGDRHCLVGTKTGKLIIYDIATSESIESIDAHENSISSLCFTPDQKGVITGSADKSVKFWNFDLVIEGEKKKLSLLHTRSLQFSDDVLCCQITDNSKFLTVGLLDNTVKIYFTDTLKFFLCLYGHSLPVLCLDTSSDNTLIVTGSADKNVKIWGMDFGDCHKSLFAHDDSVTSVQFLRKTHLFFSAGKDGKIKQWDADKFEKILVLSDHHNEIWSLAVSSNGKFLVSASHDKSIRLWEKSEEILVLQEEQEMEREVEYEKSLEQHEDVIPGESSNNELTLANKKTIETVKSAEEIIEAVDIVRKEEEQQKSGEIYQSHPLIKMYGSSSLSIFLLEIIRKIKSSELEKCLLMVPFGYVIDILRHLAECIERNHEIELATRCVLFLIKIHQGTLLISSDALPILDKLKDTCSPRINYIRDLLGFNLAALRFLRLELAEKKQIQLFAEATQKFKEKRKKKKTIEQAYILG